MKKLLQKTIGFFINVVSIISLKTSARLALYLFSTPRKGRINEKQSDFLNTAFTEKLSYNDFQIMTYRWVGNKKTVLLAHGWESNAARWEYLVLFLKKRNYNIIALDAPAHGNSGSKKFNAILYSEFIHVVSKKFNPDIIIGHSVGGMASVFFHYKIKHPTVDKLVLLGSPSEFTDVLNRYVKMMSYNKRVAKRLDLLILERFGNLPEVYSTSKFIESIESKGLIIHDEQDDIIPFNDALLIKNNFKNGTLISTNGLGHSLNDDVVTTHIHEFIED